MSLSTLKKCAKVGCATVSIFAGLFLIAHGIASLWFPSVPFRYALYMFAGGLCVDIMSILYLCNMSARSCKCRAGGD